MKALRIASLLSAAFVALLGLYLMQAARPAAPGGGDGTPHPSAPADHLPTVDPAALPRLYPVPPFALTDARGQRLGLESLAGKPWVAMFFFTSCAGPCPIMTAAMAGVYKEMEAASPVRFVSITVDPETDTPERLAAYGARYGADFARWHFLTGPIAEIEKLAHEGFKLGSADKPIFHSDRFVLVDGAGQVRGYFAGTEAEGVAKLKAAIAALLEETPS